MISPLLEKKPSQQALSWQQQQEFSQVSKGGFCDLHQVFRYFFGSRDSIHKNQDVGVKHDSI